MFDRQDAAVGSEMCGTSRAALRLLVCDSVGATAQEKPAAGQEPCWMCPSEGFP